MNPEKNPRASSYKTMRTLPLFLSRRFFLLFGFTLIPLALIYGYHSAHVLFPLTLDALLLLAAFLDYVVGPSPRDIHMERLLHYPLAVDRANEIPLEVVSTGTHPVSVRMYDDYPEGCSVRSLPVRVDLQPRVPTRVSYQLTPLERGKVRFGDIHFWVAGSLGLVWKHGESPGSQDVKLYPGLALIERHRVKGRPLSAHDMVWPAWKRGEGTEFDSLREYGVGDDSRLIHWSTTARKGKLIVRQNRVERGQAMFLILDAGRMMTARVLGKTKLDHALQAALLLAYAGLEAGDKVGVMAVAREVLCFLPPSGGMAQFGRILDTTYALDPRLEEPRFHVALSNLATRLRKRSLVVIFTDFIDERASQGLMRICQGLLPRHLPLVAALSDIEVARVADASPENWHDLYRQGVAAELLERRGELLAKLGSSGVMVLDVRPEKISAAVLDRYLSIKTRNLL
jgi:uncharacterized protein (DUF58 family)